MMSETLFYDTLRQGLWVAFVISIPILSVALASGLIVGLFQALTSIQEMTLTFVPKLAAIIGVFWITMAFMSEKLVALFQNTLIPIIAGGV
ncbi:flagellar biosynthetic protein FliQ [Yoonia maricola]|nr:flagellar biosynthetic protein FliQ [Yoonia maricola]